MKFKITVAGQPGHNSLVTCVGWSSTEEVYSAGDDNQILCWSVTNSTSTKLTQLNQDIFPIDIHFLPRAGKHGDLILLTAADGRFYILNKAGRIERSVEAHKGAVLVGQWSYDGTGLLTAGEDGFVKVWSRSGMLRSTVVSSDNSVYGACWSPEGQGIAYTQGKCVVIKQLAPNTKPIKWKAHEGLVLCLAWSAASELIVSGGEDCKYRVWDGQGRQIFSSSIHDNHITTVAWAPNGDLFSLGSYDTLRLCDYSGWSRSLEKPNTGSIYKMAWSNDGTQLAAACANGNVLFAHVVQRTVDFQNFSACLTERKTITVKDMLHDAEEYLDLPDGVIHMSLRYSHLVVTTPNQCYIYNVKNWNTPIIIELKDGSVIHLELCEKYFLLVERTSIGIYSYQGKLVASPRWPNMRFDLLRKHLVSLCPDAMAVRDISDSKTVHLIDLGINRNTKEPSYSILHTMQIIQIALDQWGDSQARTLAVLDKTRDLFLVQIRSANKSFTKLGRKIDSFTWNATSNIIAAIQDAHLIVWYCPNACYDPKIVYICSLQYESAELGRNPKINDFVGSSVSIRRADGSLIDIPISPFPELLHKHIEENKWMDAITLCRNVNKDTLWACLAVLATQANDEAIDIAEEAFARINYYEKVFFIQYVKTLPTKAERKSNMALLAGKIQDAESILLHNGMVFQAIYMNVNLHKWERALDLAVKHKTHIDSVLYLRDKYLESLEKTENNHRFLELRESVPIDEEKIQQKITLELQKRKPSV